VQDAIEKTINIMNLETSSGATSFNNSDQQQQQRISSKVEFSGDAVDDVRKQEEVEEGSVGKSDKYPAEWNFSMNIPESSYRPPIEIPSEDIGHGINRCVYYVCHSLNDGEWIELPLATPHQINVSRRIRKYLTGNLDAEIFSYPAFPGTERNYLRSLIARISAGTHVAPKKFFKFGTLNSSDEEEKEDESEDEFEDVCSKFSMHSFTLEIRKTLSVCSHALPNN
jgi:radial spoke head protein 4A